MTTTGFLAAAFFSAVFLLSVNKLLSNLAVDSAISFSMSLVLFTRRGELAADVVVLTLSSGVLAGFVDTVGNVLLDAAAAAAADSAVLFGSTFEDDFAAMGSSGLRSALAASFSANSLIDSTCGSSTESVEADGSVSVTASGALSLVVVFSSDSVDALVSTRRLLAANGLSRGIFTSAISSPSYVTQNGHISRVN